MVFAYYQGLYKLLFIDFGTHFVSTGDKNGKGWGEKI
jgi:hypothetical protein